jgi:hypothetical protein
MVRLKSAAIVIAAKSDIDYLATMTTAPASTMPKTLGVCENTVAIISA